MRANLQVLTALLVLTAPELLAQRPSLTRAAGSQIRCRREIFEGTVRAGQSFHRPFGSGLELLLEAVPHGWIVRVLPATGSRPDVDFAELATPPFRSINPLLLTTDFGFRSQDVVGWNPRTFRYITHQSEFAAAREAYRAVLSPASPTPGQERAVTSVAARAAEGTLEILDAALIPGTADPTRSAALLATHFDSTAHTVQPGPSGSAGRLGEVASLRFRVSLSVSGAAACGDETKFTMAP